MRAPPNSISSAVKAFSDTLGERPCDVSKMLPEVRRKLLNGIGPNVLYKAPDKVPEGQYASR